MNECICHGIPDDRELADGDIVNIDVTVYLNVRLLLGLRQSFAVLLLLTDSVFTVYSIVSLLGCFLSASRMLHVGCVGGAGYAATRGDTSVRPLCIMFD